jgi:deoxyribonuclease V
VSGNTFHTWDVGENEAKQIQLRLAPLVVCKDDFTNVGLIGGVSIRPLDDTTIQAAVSVLDLPTMKKVDSVTASAKSTFPYIAGLRAFQSGSASIAAFEKLHTRPDLVLWDGHGIAHPRRCGLASHLGVLLDIPSVGIAEELVYGTCNVDALGKERGSRIPVLDPSDGTEIGAAVRTRSHVRPVYVSVGHRVSLESAIKIVQMCAPISDSGASAAGADAELTRRQTGGTEQTQPSGCVNDSTPSGARPSSTRTLHIAAKSPWRWHSLIRIRLPKGLPAPSGIRTLTGDPFGRESRSRIFQTRTVAGFKCEAASRNAVIA